MSAEPAYDVLSFVVSAADPQTKLEVVRDMAGQSTSADWRHHRARVAIAVRYGDDEAEARARADLKAARATDYIRDLVASWPPIPDAKLRELAVLLAPETDGP